jgi:predicted transcriptional regulator
MPKRTIYDIYKDTLETIRRKGCQGITRISYGANLPVDRANDTVSFLAESGLIKEEEYNGSRGYRITARGGEFLQALKTVNTYIDPDNFEDSQIVSTSRESAL